MACGAEQLGVGQRFAPAGTGAPASRAGGPAYLQDLTAGGSSQLEGDEDVGAEHVQHLHAGEDGGESVGQGQGVEGDAAQPGQHGQQRGGEQPGLPGPHQQGAEDADADLTCGGSRASRVGPAQPRPQHGHLTAGHGPAAPNEGGGFGGHQERARSATGGTATPQDRQSSVVGGLSPSPANHGVCGARGRPWGSLDPPRLCPGCAAQWVTQLGDTGRLNPPNVCFPLLAMGRTLRPGEPAGVPCLIPSPAAASHSSGAAFPTPGTWMRGGLGCSMGAPPPITSSPARAVAKRPNSATSLYTAPWNPRCSSWRTKSLHRERVSTTPTPTPPLTAPQLSPKRSQRPADRPRLPHPHAGLTWPSGAPRRAAVR